MVNSSLAEKRDFFAPEIRVIDMPKDDIKWCIVSLSDVIGAGKRLEAAVFEVDGRHARDAIANCKYESKSFTDWITNAYYPGRFKRIYSDAANGIPFFLPSQMTDIYPKAEKFISALTKCSVDELRLSAGDVLLTRSGTIGNVTIVSKTLESKIFSDDVIRITPTKNDSGFLYAYFRSPVGSTILQTNQYGSVVQHIEPEHLADIPIPNPPDEIKQCINDLIMRSFFLRDQSNELIDKATVLLKTELDLPPIQEIEATQFDSDSDINNFEVKLSDTKGRLDASYHIPIVATIIELLQQNALEVTTVGDNKVSRDIILPGRFKRVYVEKEQGHVFFGGKQIHELDPSNKKYLSTAKHSVRITKELEISENTILITRSGTIGKIAIAPKHWEHWIASDHIIRVFPAHNDIAGYLYIYLSSEYGYELITRFTYGSVVDEIDANHVSQIPIPLLNNSTIQAEINSLSLEANELRHEAYQLEREAMRVMNDEVIFAK